MNTEKSCITGMKMIEAVCREKQIKIKNYTPERKEPMKGGGGFRMKTKLDQKRQELIEENIGLVRELLLGKERQNDYDDLYSESCLNLCFAASLWEEGDVPFEAFAERFILEGLDEFIFLNKLDRPPLTHKGNVAFLCPVADGGFESAEIRLLLADMRRYVTRHFSTREALIVILLLKGYSKEEAANELKISMSAVDSARQKAADVFIKWFRD